MALAKPCRDHLGNEFKSKAALCRYYGISAELFTQRQLKGMSLEDSLKPAGISPWAGKKCKDHLGNEFKTRKAMTQHYNVPFNVFSTRLYNGWSLKDALTTPVRSRIASKPSSTLVLSIGYEDFKEVRTEGLYYVDKTGLIEQLLTTKAKVTLFTRPRRFGKTLNMSMLKYFFEIGSDPSLFDGLSIMQRKDLCEQYMGQYPVISLTLKEVEGKDFDSAYNSLCGLIQAEADRLNYLADSPSISNVDKQNFLQLLSNKPEKNTIKGSLKTLCKLLEKHHGKKVIVLIDEYDVPLDKAYINGYYDEMIDLIRAMFGSALKTNSSLQLAVLTGCLRVSKESVFTGLNNFKVCGVSDLKYTEYFGFTEGEVHKMFEYYSVENRIQDAKEWYDGYRFGNQEIYCPWDIINFCDDLYTDPDFKPIPYWTNTSGNDVVQTLINKCDTEFVKDDIEELINGGTIVKELNLNITHKEINEDINNLWSLLYMTGYLTTTKPPNEDIFSLRIPNHEINQIYNKQVRGWFKNTMRKEAREKNKELQNLYKAFEVGDSATIEELLNERLLNTISYNDSDEAYYHGFLTGILDARPDWGIASNHEAGHGRPDIILKTTTKKFGAIIEVKHLKAKETKKLNEECKKALKQIEDQKYASVLINKKYTHIYRYGIAFAGKCCKVAVQKPNK